MGVKHIELGIEGKRLSSDKVHSASVNLLKGRLLLNSPRRRHRWEFIRELLPKLLGNIDFPELLLIEIKRNIELLDGAIRAG